MRSLNTPSKWAAKRTEHLVEHLNALTSFWLHSNWKEHAHGKRFASHCPQNAFPHTIFLSVRFPYSPAKRIMFFFYFLVGGSRHWHRTPIVIKLFPNQWIDNIWYVLQLNVSMLVGWYILHHIAWAKMSSTWWCGYCCYGGADCTRRQVNRIAVYSHFGLIPKPTKENWQKMNKRKFRENRHRRLAADVAAAALFCVRHWLTSTSNAFDSELSWRETQVPTSDMNYCTSHTL